MGEAACNDNGGAAGRDIDREASRWLVRLDDAPQDMVMRSAFEAWLAADARHAQAWTETIAVSRLIASAVRAEGNRNVLPFSKARAGADGFGRAWRTWVPAAVAAACVLWIAAPGLIVRWQADHVAGTAEVRTLRLADGSRVSLAPGSAIEVDIKGKGRFVRLLRGEAYFDIAHDSRRPFRVFAGASQTRVLGTAFDVLLMENGAHVSVSRGLVEVALPGCDAPLREWLTRGQALTLDWRGIAARGAIRPERIAAWREGRAIVNDRPIGEVIAALRPWYKGYIIARGAGLQDRRVTGVYDLRNADTALSALAKAHDLNVRQLSPWLRIVTVR